jgi:hypothetical protein
MYVCIDHIYIYDRECCVFVCMTWACVRVYWQRGNHAMVTQLVAAGVDVNVIDRCGRTAMDIAFDEETRQACLQPHEGEVVEEEA